MHKNPIKKNISSPVAIIIVLALAVGASGIALWFSKSEPKADAFVVPRAARVERVEGDVGIARALEAEDDQIDWDEATLNAPLSVGDRIYAKENSRAQLAFTGRNFARLDPQTSLDVISLADRRTQLALRDGSAIFDLGHLEPGELFEVATPNGAVDFYEPGLYQIGLDDSGNTLISVLSGLAQVVGLAGSGEISKGEMLTLLAATAGEVLMSRLAPDLAGNIVDDYYGYRYPDAYDGRYSSYDVYLDDPYYYDPYRRHVSYQRVGTYDVPGLYDLDYYGDWVDVNGYGHCWSPRVDAGWAPYRNGYWDTHNVWGPTWVSNEPWGWAPYHYGRWANANGRWVWVPDRHAATPVYSPAPVVFIPLRQTNQIAWVPLAPGERYVPRYYDANFQPQYLAAPEVVRQIISVQQSYVNVAVPQAITAIPVDQFGQVITPYTINQVNHQVVAQSQPVLDLYEIESLRQAVRRGSARRHRFEVPAFVEQQVLSRPVVASALPNYPIAHRGLLESLQVAPLNEKQRKRRMKFERTAQVVSALRGDGMPQPPIPQAHASARAQERGQRIAALAVQAAQGDNDARRKMEKLQRKQERAIRSQSLAVQSAAAGRVVVPNQGAQQGSIDRELRRQQKAQKRLERQQRAVAGQQPSAAVFQQQQSNRNREIKRQNRELRRQSALQRAPQVVAQPQHSAAQAQRDALMRQQRKAQKRAERQQRQAVEQQRVQQQRVQQQRVQQQRVRQQRIQQSYQQQANRQKQVTALEQAQKQQRQQRKAERRAARQQQAQQQVVMPQQRQQRAPVYQRPAQQAPARQQVSPRQATAAAQHQQSNRAARKAEKAQRRAGRGQ